MAHACGDVVLFLDDDALAPPGWVHAHVRAYDDPNVQGAGGVIMLDFVDGRPSWVDPHFNPVNRYQRARRSE